MKAVWTSAIALLLAVVLGAQENGVAADKILVGQACALSGPAASLGQGMQAGLQAAFAEINAKGGVGGRKIELLSVNDGYEPNVSEIATKKLIEKDKVFALIGAVGTPTAKVAIPIATAANVPFIGAFTGAELLRTPFNKNVVNIRASYYQEMEKQAQVLVDARGLKKIACFYQDDAFGQAGLAGIKLALERRKMELVATGTFARNTTAVKPGLVDVMKGAPDAIVMVGPYKPCAEFIKLATAEASLKSTVFTNISFVGTEALVEALKGVNGDFLVTQVVPFPWDAANPLVASYHAAMKTAGHDKQIGFISLEGYVVGRVFAAALAKVEGAPTRAALIAELEKFTALEIDGLKLAFGAEDHQGLDEVFLTTIRDGKVLPFAADGKTTAK